MYFISERYSISNFYGVLKISSYKFLKQTNLYKILIIFYLTSDLLRVGVGETFYFNCKSM